MNEQAIQIVRQQKAIERQHPQFAMWQTAIKQIEHLRAEEISLDQGVVTLGSAEEINESDRALVYQSLQAFQPWKKGPFRIFGIDIDAEWRSDWKWERILPHISPLQDKVVADIGCHNGYFMFRMAAHAPRLVVGFEPVAKLWFNFSLLQNLANIPQLVFEPLGVEHVDLYPQYFDTVFCLGILYHHSDPPGLLKKIHSSLKKGGELIIDCQGIPGDEAVALVPEKKYAGATGMWFLPTKKCLQHWLQRTGFRQIECFYEAPLSPDEQRKTPWAPIQSLAEFLSPSNPLLTIEGYPAPLRFYMKAVK